MLEQVNSRAEKVPVIGQTLGRFMGFYAKGARACGDAAVKIQQKIIVTEMDNFMSNPTPERHLYTASEIDAIAFWQNADIEKIIKMAQVRRLVVLVHASGLGEAQDARWS